jgi:hypothetical protein
LGVDEEGNPTHNHIIVHLGNIVLQEGTYDADGNEITAPVVSDNHHVDVLWDGVADPSWNNQLIWCEPCGIHGFGIKAAQEYTAACYEANPDMIPVVEEEQIEE